MKECDYFAVGEGWSFVRFSGSGGFRATRVVSCLYVPVRMWFAIEVVASVSFRIDAVRVLRLSDAHVSSFFSKRCCRKRLSSWKPQLSTAALQFALLDTPV